MNVKSFCGLHIIRRRERREIIIKQTAAIEKLLKLHRFTEVKSDATPAVNNLQLSVVDCPRHGSEEHVTMSLLPYREIVGSCLYFAVMTRPDIAFVVNTLARFSHNPGRQNWHALRHLLRYLKGTANYGLRLGHNSNEGATLRAFSDASWASNPDDRHSTSGYAFTFENSLIAWWSRHQLLLTRSSFEADLVAVYGCTAELIWIRNLLKDCDINPGTTEIAVDNSTTIDQLREHCVTKRTRHIALRFYSTVEFIIGEIIRLVKVPGTDNEADMFTSRSPCLFYVNIAIDI
mmetsp:Transcript_11700/g.15888  ORF Transcript_11700/g.15888 Transcript_11700/m.15888 type:complete len:290 (-) Transcript_11700:151-1020(-)|eukprot:CAMPEP_0197303086 /NCGR_PEP_ID=MMETSP0890-20130614/51448_1 /TAXON_ID=44058 ORGANISM="Aureoumbra lagunensis, Strain CCMP1510" /NCGR_SAMPLE_ID=MMETSP0890 /ASSEMBLY_ACC=CAM_ASM_000533 /LENGTH=289 /DNA_ID=CAMNT_0042782837 /DNA_START=944 /DNA_END=1813 /DNA_ORIENTATION=+